MINENKGIDNVDSKFICPKFICPKLGDLSEENSALLSIHYSDEIRTKELEKELEKLRERNEELEKSKTDMHLDRIKMIQQILSLQSQINLMKK